MNKAVFLIQPVIRLYSPTVSSVMRLYFPGCFFKVIRLYSPAASTGNATVSRTSSAGKTPVYLSSCHADAPDPVSFRDLLDDRIDAVGIFKHLHADTDNRDAVHGNRLVDRQDICPALRDRLEQV